MKFLGRASRFLKTEVQGRRETLLEEHWYPQYTPSACDASTVWINDINELDIMADYLYRASIIADWLRKRALWPTHHEDICVVVCSTHANTEAVRPECNRPDANITKLTWKCEAQAALTMRNDLTKKFLQRVPPMSNVVKLLDGQKIDVYESFANAVPLQRPKKSGFCLIRDIEAAFVWTNNAKTLIAKGRYCEQALSTMLWTTPLTNTRSWALSEISITAEKDTGTNIEVHEIEIGEDNENCEPHLKPHREMRLVWPVVVASTFILMGLATGQLLSELVLAIIRDGTYYQVLFILYIPLSCFLSAVKTCA